MSDLPEGFVLDQPPEGFTLDAPKVAPARVAGQFGTGVNDALYRAVMAAPDLSAKVTRWLGLTSPDTPLPSEAFQNWARSNGNERPAEWEPQNKTEQVARDTGTGVGDALGFMAPFGLAAKIAAVPSVVRSASSAMAAQPALQALSAGVGSAVGSATDNPYLGMAANFALPFALHGGQRMVSAAPAATTQEAERRALLEEGRAIGAEPTAGKILGSKKLQTVESWLNNTPLPLLGGKVEHAETATRNAYQKAAIEKAGTYGETAATPDVLQKTRDRIGANFDRLESGTTVNFDNKMVSDLQAAKADFSKQLRDQMPDSVLKKLDELTGAANTVNQPGVQSVSIDGATYKNIRSKLSAQLAKSSGTDAQAIGKMIDALDGAAERSLPRDMVKDWQTARQQWRNYLALESAVKANNADTAVGNMSTAAYGRASRGNPDIERLGQYGNAMVGDKAANHSGTARHLGAGHVMGGAAGLYEGMQHAPMTTLYGMGAAALPYGFDLAMNNPLTRALLLSRYRNPSQSLVSPGVYGSLAGQASSRDQKP